MSDSLKRGITHTGVGARLQRALPSRNWVALILALLILDQGIKIAVLLTLAPHQDVPLIGRWVMLRLELNDGTALGFPFASELDRYLRILLKAALAVAVFLSLAFFQRRRGPRLLLIGLALCVAGLVGNLIDRVAHGALLGNALPRCDPMVSRSHHRHVLLPTGVRARVQFCGRGFDCWGDACVCGLDPFPLREVGDRHLMGANKAMVPGISFA